MVNRFSTIRLMVFPVWEASFTSTYPHKALIW